MYYYRSLALEVGVRQGAGMEDLYPFDHCKTIKKQHINNTTPFIQEVLQNYHSFPALFLERHASKNLKPFSYVFHLTLNPDC
jgi:hypothetical protein